MGHWRKAETGSQRHQRVMAQVPARISTVDAERDPDTGKLFFRSTETTTANLSRGGAFVHSWEPLAPGRRVVINFELPTGAEIQVVGRVAWTRRELRLGDTQELQPPGYGVEFVGGTAAEVAALDTYLNSPHTWSPPETTGASLAQSSSAYS
ncbi:MAG: PilZ domain-containing protein [Myxococcota bacterium]